MTTTNGVVDGDRRDQGHAHGPTEKRTVTTGITANGQTEITSGLEAGEQVVVTLPAALGGLQPHRDRRRRPAAAAPAAAASAAARAAPAGGGSEAGAAR